MNIIWLCLEMQDCLIDGCLDFCGVIFDWDNYWALEYTSGPSEDLKYVDQIHQYYQYFYKSNTVLKKWDVLLLETEA